MAQIINLAAEIGGNMISDDAEPALTLSNSSTGPGLVALGAVLTSTASIDTINSRTITSAGDETVLTLERTASGSYSVASLVLGSNSAASGVTLELSGTAFVSVMSIDFGAGADWASAGAIRVKATDGDSLFWIPLLPDSAIEAAAAYE